MVNLIINDQRIKVADGTTIMEAARQVGIRIPHLCFLKDINEIGACRVCVVEVEGMEKLVTACNTPVEEGMVIHTNSPRVRSTRATNLKLILSNHNCQCAVCSRSGNCSLQSIVNDLGSQDMPYEPIPENFRWDKTFPLIRDASKCIKCMRCIQVCEKIQSAGIWNLVGSGFRTTVDAPEKGMGDCVLCGQCITHCPVGALSERNDTLELFKALADPEIVTMVQIAPAVRAAWGEGIGLYKEESTLGKLISALRQMGVDYIFDTNYAADLTIMEEGSEFLERFRNKKNYSWPMFTSCCPGWLRFVKTQYPQLIPNLSTAKSPQQMFGAMSKTYMAQKLGLDPEKIYSISVMPCVSKKFEGDVQQVNDAGHGKDVDLVLTTRELNRLIRADRIDVEALTEGSFDDIFGEGTGAAVIFGSTGGVMEAALRSAYFMLTGKNPKPDAFKKVRSRDICMSAGSGACSAGASSGPGAFSGAGAPGGPDGWREAVFEIEGVAVRVAAVSGLGNTRRLIEAIQAGTADYDFVEVMACPGGCAGGGGQPIKDGEELAAGRGRILYGLDSTAEKRFSHENSAVRLTYSEFLGEPLSHRAHELLHTDLTEWEF